MRVLASVAVVDLVVTAHDGTSASADGIRKRPKVQFMESCILLLSVCSIRVSHVLAYVDICADTFGYVESITKRFTSLSEMLLLVTDIMLSA